MYKIAICDDDITFSSEFEKMLSETLEARKISFQLTRFTDTAALRQALESGQKYHLLFLDIMFQTEQGIRFARFLQKKKFNIDIIFVTSTPDYAVASYDVSSLHYLIKPVDQKKLDDAVDRFLARHASQRLYFNTPKGSLQVRIDDILYFEIFGHKITIHKTNGKKEICGGTLKELELLLPAQIFVRPHRSYLVNFDYISEISRYQIQLSSGDTVPISKNLYKQIQSSFIDYAEKKCLSF